MAEPERISVHLNQTDLMRRHRAKWRHSQETLAYCTLIMALEARYRLVHISSARHASSDDLRKAERIKIERIKSQRTRARKGSKRDELVLHLPLIRRLLEEEKLSLREVVFYLKDSFVLTVAPSYLSKIVKESAQLGSPERLPALSEEIGLNAASDDDSVAKGTDG